MSSQQQRENFWNYLVKEKVERPKGVTNKRLEKIKESVLADDYFWFQVIDRFGGESFMVGDLFYRRYADKNSEQSRAQFWLMVRERIFAE